MDSQRIRPSLADLANLDLDAPAFSEWEINQSPAVSVSRTRPPTILSTSVPPPVPEIPRGDLESIPLAVPAPSRPSKPKSRFALQREKEAEEGQASAFGTGKGVERFELDLDREDGKISNTEGSGALPRATTRFSLVKDVTEKPSTRLQAPRPPAAPSLDGRRPAGFPPVGKGIFQKRAGSNPSPRPAPPLPYSAPTSSLSSDADELAGGSSVDGLLNLVSRENESLLQSMSEAQILEEQRQIREDMGLSEGMINMLRQRAQTRLQAGPTPSASTSTSTSTMRPTPRSRAPPPTAKSYHSKASSQQAQGHDLDEEEEGTPEYIRKHFFPNEPANPALDWMKPPPARRRTSADTSSSSSLHFVFDLSGALVAKADADPADFGGDHHVSSSSNFTIPSLLSLTASSVPSQRSMAYSTLLRILSHPSDHSLLVGSKEWSNLRHRLLRKAAWALRDPNRGVTIAALDVLDYLFATESLSPAASTIAILPNAEVPKTFLDCFEAPESLASVTSHLALTSSTLPQSSLLQLLKLLANYVSIAQRDPSTQHLESLFSTHKLLESIAERYIATPWPSPAPTEPSLAKADSPLAPSPLALSIFSALARSSRSRAKELYHRKLVEPTLRYLAIPPWELAEDSGAVDLGYAMLSQSFELWQILARYGIGCQLRTLAAPLLEGGVFERVHEVCRGENGHWEWIGALLDVMSIWTVAAIDPHVTEHDIVWSQVEGWNLIALDVYEWAIAGQRKDLMAKGLNLTANWLEGSKVNKSWSGEQEREWVRNKYGQQFESGGVGRESVEMALSEISAGETDGDDTNARLVSAALRLSQSFEETSNPPTPPLFTLDTNLVQSVVASVLSRQSSRITPVLTELVLLLLPLVNNTNSRILSTILVLPLLDASQAVAARDSISYLLGTLSTPLSCPLPLATLLHADLEVPSLKVVTLLKPFYTHSIVTASGGKVVGPFSPTPRDLKLTQSLPAITDRLSTSSILSPDWPLSVLDELLRSATSPVFRAGGLPKDWDASESQLVKSSLVLMRLVSSVYQQHASERGGRGEIRVENGVLIYDLMKVFMLEKDSTSSDSVPTPLPSAERDLFRIPAIQHSISGLLQPLQISSLPPHDPLSSPHESTPSSSYSPLEVVSDRFSSAPLYQLYTDFLGLYDSISLSDRNFAHLLLPPLSQQYPVDYRRLLWTDYEHLLKTIKFRPDEILVDSTEALDQSRALRQYLEPRETNETMLQAYLDGLVQDAVDKDESPFLTLIAVHHLSRAIFATERVETESEDTLSAKTRLVKGLIGSKKWKTVRMVMRYQQAREVGERVKLFEECFESIEEQELERRISCIRDLLGSDHGDIDELGKIARG